VHLVAPGAVPPLGKGAYVGFGEMPGGPAARVIRMPDQARQYAAILYDTLHALDQEGLDWIAIVLPPEAPEWAGICDRLRRASIG
ncbi:MAG TPA: Sua5 family C-terminal domain-containing protein, partial [Anaerolineae bacterium]